MTRPAARMLLLMGWIACAGGVSARQSDRNQPMHIDADKQECSLDANGQCTFTGRVSITQGTLEIRAAKAVVHRRAGSPSRAVLSGSPATLKQELDDGAPMDAHAQTIDYDLNTEVLTMTGDVRLVQPRGTMTGARLVYDSKNGQVNSGNGNGSERVRMVIQPRNAPPAADAPATPKGKR